MSPEVNTILIGALAALLLATITYLTQLLNKKMNRVERHTSATREQVQNSHTTNLRADIDEILGGIREIRQTQQQHGRSIEGLHADLRQERIERAAGDRETRAAIHSVK